MLPANVWVQRGAMHAYDERKDNCLAYFLVCRAPVAINLGNKSRRLRRNNHIGMQKIKAETSIKPGDTNGVSAGPSTTTFTVGPGKTDKHVVHIKGVSDIPLSESSKVVSKVFSCVCPPIAARTSPAF